MLTKYQYICKTFKSISSKYQIVNSGWRYCPDTNVDSNHSNMGCFRWVYWNFYLFLILLKSPNSYRSLNFGHILEVLFRFLCFSGFSNVEVITTFSCEFVKSITFTAFTFVCTYTVYFSSWVEFAVYVETFF